MSDWRSMKSAPKDGNLLWIVVDVSGYGSLPTYKIVPVRYDTWHGCFREWPTGSNNYHDPVCWFPFGQPVMPHSDLIRDFIKENERDQS